MFTIVIVDDIRREREGIISSVDWDLLGVKVVGQADNGVNALQVIQEKDPDMVLTDIQMPLMDGIELARQIKNVNPDIKIIFLTSHSDFEYAKMAIDLDIHSYIMKPVNGAEISSAVKKAVELCKSEKSSREEVERFRNQLKESLPALKDKVFRDLLSGVYKKEEEIWAKLQFLGTEITQGEYCISIIEVDDYEMLSESMTEEEKCIFDLRASEAASVAIENSDSCMLISVSGARYVLLCKIYTKTVKNRVQDALEQLEKVRTDFNRKLGIGSSLGISSIGSELIMVPKLYNQALQALKYKFLRGKNEVLIFEELDYSEDIRIKMDAIRSDLKAILHSGCREEVDQFIEVLFESFKGDKYISNRYIQNLCFSILNYSELSLLEINESLQSVFGEDIFPWQKLVRFETILDIKQWMKNILHFIADYISSKNNSRNRKLVEQIITIINEAYAQELTVSDIASRIFLSSNYANFIFKNETGMTIPDYITTFRINKAKELLKDPAVKIYEVSEHVGYRNKSYFTQLFKEMTGMTPNEYRRKV